jgi:hypothetical protein
MDPFGGGARDPRAPTINAKNVDGRPPGRRCRRSESIHNQRRKCRRRPPWEVVPEIWERPPSTLKNVNSGPPWEAVTEIREHPPSTQTNINGGPLGGGARDPGAPTINDKKCRWRGLGRRCRRSESAHHQNKNVNGGTLGGGARDLGAPTIYTKNIDGGPLGRRCQRSGSAHHQH